MTADPLSTRPLEELAGRDVCELDTSRYGIITAVSAGDGYHRAFCSVDFEDGTHGEGLSLGPYGKGDLALVDRSEATRQFYRQFYDDTELRRTRALAQLGMYEGLLTTLAGRSSAERCYQCGEPATATCAACDRPLCEEHARTTSVPGDTFCHPRAPGDSRCPS